MTEKKIDYDAWAERVSADDYEPNMTGRVVKGVRGTPAVHDAMREMLLEYADPEQAETIRNLGGRPTLDPAGAASVAWRLRVPSSLDERFRARVESEGRSFSDVLRTAAEEYLAADAHREAS